MNRLELKRTLRELERDNWEIPSNIDVKEMVDIAMDYIGDTDSELRDDLVLTYLYRVITDGRLTNKELKELMNRSLGDNHMFYRINEVDNESAFNRSFSVLIVRYIIHYHNTHGEQIFSKEEIIKIFSRVTMYISLERDTRGYIENGGWVHALAHAATTLRTIALCNSIGRHELLDALELVKKKICISSTVYIHDEYERMVMVIINVLSRDILDERDIIDWINSFSGLEFSKSVVENMYLRENVLGFLRALYFRFKFKKAPSNIINELEHTILLLNDFHNNMVC